MISGIIGVAVFPILLGSLAIIEIIGQNKIDKIRKNNYDNIRFWSDTQC